MGIASLALEIESTETASIDERFEKVALLHMDSIYRSALYMARNETDAQDLVQGFYREPYEVPDLSA